MGAQANVATFADLFLDHSIAGFRVFLPLISGDGTTTAAWSTVYRLVGGTELDDPGISAGDIVAEHLAAGSSSVDWVPSEGRADAVTSRRLQDILIAAQATPHDAWEFTPFEVTVDVRFPASPLVTISEFFDLWRANGPMIGTIQLSDRAKLAAVPYGDSVVLSGPGIDPARLLESGLEFLPVAGRRTMPRMTWS